MSGSVMGAGVDLASACDIRICSAETTFSIKEVDVGLAVSAVLCSDEDGMLNVYRLISVRFNAFQKLAATPAKRANLFTLQETSQQRKHTMLVS